MLKTIDIGHKNYHLDSALSVLETEVSKAMFAGKVRALKIVHGHGEGALRSAVREWCEEQEGRFKAVIYGEDYDMFHQESVNMRSACGNPKDPHLGLKNRSVTYIWLW
ncbi:MAG: Smr/MutS family protein [Candidatus Marinimicrobia bacterium]|nr:Smr/MutS family protein [Candidatus Neomarinimicrobiota bacterium]MCH7762792.1 Smr/MutS family protein [Candidatus Neomarinimicrobiota bacterium]